MQETVKLLRDCPAMLIPSGLKVTLARGNELLVTHTPGGKFTVRGIFGIARIDDENADALGLAPLSASAGAVGKPENVSEPLSKTPGDSSAASGQCALASAAQEIPQATLDDLWNTAKTVFDPEIPVNIVDLGLVYRMEILKTPEGKNRVEVDMTLTAPGCSMGPAIANDLKLRLEALPSISEAAVNIVWDPPWNTDMMTMEARMILGME